MPEKKGPAILRPSVLLASSAILLTGCGGSSDSGPTWPFKTVKASGTSCTAAGLYAFQITTDYTYDATDLDVPRVPGTNFAFMKGFGSLIVGTDLHALGAVGFDGWDTPALPVVIDTQLDPSTVNFQASDNASASWNTTITGNFVPDPDNPWISAWGLINGGSFATTDSQAARVLPESDAPYHFVTQAPDFVTGLEMYLDPARGIAGGSFADPNPYLVAPGLLIYEGGIFAVQNEGMMVGTVSADNTVTAEGKMYNGEPITFNGTFNATSAVPVLYGKVVNSKGAVLADFSQGIPGCFQNQ